MNYLIQCKHFGSVRIAINSMIDGYQRQDMSHELTEAHQALETHALLI